MTSGAGQDPARVGWDVAFSEFSDPALLPPSAQSLNQIANMGRRLVSHVTPSSYNECALFNGELGFTIDRDEGDILHIKRQGTGPEAQTEATWYRGTFQNIFDRYIVNASEVTGHMPFALAMSDISSEIADEEIRIEDLMDGSNESAESPTAALLDQLNAITDLEDTDNLEDAVASTLAAYGTVTLQRREYHQLKCNPPTQDSVNIEVAKRQRAPQALQLAPRLSLMLDEMRGGRGGDFRQVDILRILENGSVEYESPKRREEPQHHKGSFSSEVTRRRAVQEALVAERMLGLQVATQEQVEWVARSLKSMLPYIPLVKAR